MRELLVSHTVSRAVKSFGITKDGQYRMLINVSGYDDVTDADMYRTEELYVFVDSKGLSEQNAHDILVEKATKNFLGLEEDAKQEPKKSATKAKKEEPKEEKVESEVEPEAEKAEPAKKAATKKKAASKPKTIAYSRDNEEHRKQLSVLISDACPKWDKSKETVEIAKGLSMGLVGQPFLDSKGEVLSDVIESITDAFSTGSNAL